MNIDYLITLTTHPMKIWWLLPQYFLTGVADVFMMVGLKESFYDHDQMVSNKSTCVCGKWVTRLHLYFVQIDLIDLTKTSLFPHKSRKILERLNRQMCKTLYV